MVPDRLINFLVLCLQLRGHAPLPGRRDEGREGGVRFQPVALLDPVRHQRVMRHFHQHIVEMIHRQGRVDILAQLFQFLRGGGLGGLPGNGGFQQQPGLGSLNERFTVLFQVHAGGGQLTGIHCHKAALALAGLDDTCLAEDLQGLAHRDAADPHHLNELFLAGEQVPFFVHALRDHAFDLLQHLRIQLDAGFGSILIGHKIFFFLF